MDDRFALVLWQCHQFIMQLDILSNSFEEKIGTHRVQIATLPEIPTVNEKPQILFRVKNNDFRYLNDHCNNH